MEKVIKIDGKDIKLKSNAMNALIYRSEFGEDIFKSTGSFLQCSDNNGHVDINKLDSLAIIKLTWKMAKAADKNVPSFETWLDTFDEFPIIDVFNEIYEMIFSNLTSTTKIKNAGAAEKPQRKG